MMVRGQLRRPSNEAGEVEVIHSQTEADPTSYSVGDVALWLKRCGRIKNHRFRSKLAVDQSFTASGREGIESILISNRCQFTLFALQTLESAGLLESLVEQCRVTLTEAAARELEQEQFAFEQQTKPEKVAIYGESFETTTDFNTTASFAKQHQITLKVKRGKNLTIVLA